MSALDPLTELLRAIAADQGMTLEELDPDQVAALLGDDLVEELLDPILAAEDEEKFNRFASIFPETGRYSRHNYPKHMEFFAVGSVYRERCFMAANRVGKTVSGAYELTCHLTGRYPHWWVGKRFLKPTRVWAAGDTNESTRDIIQLELLGTVITRDDGRKGLDGAGMIPRDTIGPAKWKAGVADLVDTIMIRHETGGYSTLGFKSFDQGRRLFQGTAKEVIWLDEECPIEVYGECVVRLATTRGVMLNTFTPLMGLSEHVLQFLPENERPTMAA